MTVWSESSSARSVTCRLTSGPPVYRSSADSMVAIQLAI